MDSINFQLFIEQLTNGLANGGIYALIALGYTMVYGVLKLINFAHGELFTLGAYLGFTILVSMGLSPYLGPILGIVVCIFLVMGLTALMGHLLERVAYRPLRKSNRLAAVVSAMGASVFFQNAIRLVWGADSLSYPLDVGIVGTVNILGNYIPVMRLIIIFVSILLMVILYVFVNHSKLGTAIRATAIDQGAAKLMGIDVRRVIALVFIIGPALGGAAGILVGLYSGRIDPMMGQISGLKAFTAAILGGIGNIPGAMIGGFILGLVEAFGATISPAWKDFFVFATLILILIFRPTGLLSERVAEKV